MGAQRPCWDGWKVAGENTSEKYFIDPAGTVSCDSNSCKITYMKAWNTSEVSLENILDHTVTALDYCDYKDI